MTGRGDHVTVELAKTENNATAFQGSLANLTEPVTALFHIGDATSEPFRIDPIPRPILTVTLLPTPPAYAAKAAPPRPPRGTRTIFALEGSTVGMEIDSENKPLKSVTLQLETTKFELTPDPAHRHWRFVPEGTPFDDIEAPLAFSLNAVDTDGLSLTEPLTGSIRLRPDTPPRVAGAAAVRRVLPTAHPEVRYGASDDFGLSEVNLDVEVQRQAGNVDEYSVILFPVSLAASKTPRDQRSNLAQGSVRLDLAAYQLQSGDRVRVLVKATDQRGNRPGHSAESEPLNFEVTDRDGLLASLLEADEEGAERLDAVIRRQLGLAEDGN